MTATIFSAKPGQYVWDDVERQFIGRINKDGTEDRRFSQNGECSFLNNILSAVPQWRPSDPHLFASQALSGNKSSDPESNGYLLNGFAVLLSGITSDDLSLELDHWILTAKDKIKSNRNFSTLAEMFECIDSDTEMSAKYEALTPIYRKEITKRNFSSLYEITQSDIALQKQRNKIAVETKELKKRLKKGQQVAEGLSDTSLEFIWECIHGSPTIHQVCDHTTRWRHKYPVTLDSYIDGFTLYLDHHNTSIQELAKSVYLRKYIVEIPRDPEELFESICMGHFRNGPSNNYYLTAHQKGLRVAIKNSQFLCDHLSALRYCIERRPDSIFAAIYLCYVNYDFLHVSQSIDCPSSKFWSLVKDHLRPSARKGGSGYVIEFNNCYSVVGDFVDIVTWKDFYSSYSHLIPSHVDDAFCTACKPASYYIEQLRSQYLREKHARNWSNSWM